MILLFFIPAVKMSGTISDQVHIQYMSAAAESKHSNKLAKSARALLNFSAVGVFFFNILHFFFIAKESKKLKQQKYCLRGDKRDHRCSRFCAVNIFKNELQVEVTPVFNNRK